MKLKINKSFYSTDWKDSAIYTVSTVVVLPFVPFVGLIIHYTRLGVGGGKVKDSILLENLTFDVQTEEFSTRSEIRCQYPKEYAKECGWKEDNQEGTTDDVHAKG